MLADLLFLDCDGLRLLVGMVQLNSGSPDHHGESSQVAKWQAFGCYPDAKHVAVRALGFHATREFARETAEGEARRQYGVDRVDRKLDGRAEALPHEELECGRVMEAVA